ncbi:MAG: hypothetical protein QXR48_04545 [Candidatus Woesearchaeota archaeon]
MLGMTLMVVAGIVFYASGIAQQRVFVRLVEASSAKELVEQCLGIIADDALLTIGKHGGYAELGTDYFEPINTSYLYDFGENKVPDIAIAEQQLAEYVDAHISNCIGSFELLKEKGVEVVEKSQPKTTVIIAEKDVRFSLDYPIEEKKAGTVTIPEFLPVIKFVRLKEILQLANDIVSSEVKNNGLFDLDIDCELDITHWPYQKTLITIITDHNFLIQDAPYKFVFAHRR